MNIVGEQAFLAWRDDADVSGSPPYLGKSLALRYANAFFESFSHDEEVDEAAEAPDA